MDVQSGTSLPGGSIGELFDPVLNRAMMPALLRRAREEEPVFYSERFNAWVVTRYKDVKFVLDHTRDFSSVGTLDAGAPISPEARSILEQGAVQYPTPPVLANSDAPDHPRMRGAVNKELAPRRFAEMEPLLADIATTSINRWIESGHTDFVTSFAYDYPLTVILGVLGLPLCDLERIKAWGTSWIQLLFDTTATAHQQAAWATSIVEYQAYILDFIKQVRNEPRGDFVSGLVASVYESRRMSVGELVHLIGLNIIPGAHESTAAFLTSCLHNLLTKRKYWEELCENQQLIPNAVEEVLRFDGPGVGFYRRATAEVTLSGTTIPAGSRVFYCHYSANWDETVFEQPEIFDIHRANASANIMFGHGNHFCLGAPLARREGRIAIEILTARMPTLRLVPAQPLEYMSSFVVRGLNHLQLEWDERN